MKSRQVASGSMLILLGLFVAGAGVLSMPMGSVAGGTIIWILLFGGSAVFFGAGCVLIFRATRTGD